MIKVEKINGKLIFRDSNGKFTKPTIDDWNGLKHGEISYIKTFKNLEKEMMDNMQKISKELYEENLGTYTLNLKVISYYDVDVKAKSFQDAMEQVKNLNVYKIVTEEIPMDTETPVELIGLYKQD